MNCGARVFMADFEDSSTLISGNLVTGHLNLRNALLREIGFSAPTACALGKPRSRPRRAADDHREPGMLDSGGHDAGPRRGEMMPATAVPAR
jgi:malate synthase